MSSVMATLNDKFDGEAMATSAAIQQLQTDVTGMYSSAQSQLQVRD